MEHEPTLDPRIDWMSEGLANDHDVCEIGFHRAEKEPGWEELSGRRVRVRLDRLKQDWDWVPTARQIGFQTSIGMQALMMLYMLAELPSRPLAQLIGALDAVESDLQRFRWYCQHFVQTNGALLQAANLSVNST